jgi:hypothetical protein
MFFVTPLTALAQPARLHADLSLIVLRREI